MWEGAETKGEICAMRLIGEKMLRGSRGSQTTKKERWKKKVQDRGVANYQCLKEKKKTSRLI